MAGRSDPLLSPVVRVTALAIGGVVLCWFFPLFHVRPLAPLATAKESAVPASTPAAFDPRIAAEKIWKGDLTPAAGRATELKQVVQAVRANAESAKKSFAKASGVGAEYYFVRGSGKVVTRDRNYVRVAVEGAPNEIVALRIGPVFGNTVRDGCGLLDVNAFPGLQEFNALAAELNALVEKNVLPNLREKANVGATLHFAGCAEAPESAAEVGEPVLTLIPIQAEVR